MSERRIIDAIKDYINRQDGEWRFVRGRDSLNKVQTIKRLDRDKKFRMFMVRIVVAQTVEILGRSPQ